MGRHDYQFDESCWPLVRITVPVDDSSRAVFDRHLANLRGLLERREPYVIVLDLRVGANFPAEQRERLRQQRRAFFSEIQRYQRGMAFVVSNGFQRAVLGAITWLAPEPCPTKIFSTIAEAEAWATSCLTRQRAA